MKKSRIVMTISLILIVSLALCGCFSEEHFSFYIQDFMEVQVSDYFTSPRMEKYTVFGVVIRGYIEENENDHYAVELLGYSQDDEKNTKLQVNSIYLYNSFGDELISLPNHEGLYDSFENLAHTFIVKDFEGADFTVGDDEMESYGELTLKMTVGIIKGEESEFRELVFVLQPKAYMYTTLPMPT